MGQTRNSGGKIKMADEKKHTAEEVVKYFKDEFKTKIKSSEIKKRTAGSKKNEMHSIWMKIEKDSFKAIIEHLIKLDYPHLSVVSGNDLGKTIELIYHFTIYSGTRMSEIALNMSV